MTHLNKKTPETAFVICVEKGPLEYKALCLILSLRKNWGRWSEAPVYAYGPRVGHGASPWLLEVFERFSVVPVAEPINVEFTDFPLANKPLSMAHAEERLDRELLVFLDSDILCWQDPCLFELPGGKDLALVVEGTKTAASAGSGDPNESMWQHLYRLAEVTHEPYVTTQLTDQHVRGWWNSGVIVCRRAAGLMARWRDLFVRAMHEVPFAPEVHHLREQMTMSALVAAVYDRFQELPISYNYHVQNHYHYRGRGVPPEGAVLWHYQPFLNRAFRKFASRIDAAGTTDDKIGLAENFIEDVRTDYARLFGRDESLLKTWRRRLRIGPRLRKLLAVSKPGDPA